ncbi:MAG: alanine--tRNA ligase [Kiritimatiellae bacterium]|nr:alanine--tRNA ligase [Kiritimatiellia bacterium]
MTASAIRQSFLDFFRDKGHTIVASSPVVLPSDPTLLFANAGMNQFKEIFLGARQPAARRVADSQKCIRVSGKHNDLEEVGRDTYHHTFFEMLGNWSFGDYYKAEAIAWAWELLTGVWGLPRARLWATVYRTDEEAERLWKEHTDILPAHILRFGEKDNFWEMGDTGPCGPCSEIHMDLTPDGRATPDMINAGRADVIELWNLVFMQYNRTSDGTLEDLPSKHVDTGMGFERVASVIQGKTSNYDSDVFSPLLDAIRSASGKAYAGEDAVGMRVIADHVRALSFAIADGVLPSNEGRGYVLRRLLRRAARFGRRLGLKPPFMPDLLPVLIESMGAAYPELLKQRAQIERALAAEEESFAVTLDRGMALFEEVAAPLARSATRVFPGAQAFKLYDTYGFPLDLTRMMAAEQGLTLDEHEFARHMEEQRARARAARKGGDAREADVCAALIARGARSEFVGYSRWDTEAEVLALISNGTEAGELATGAEGAVLLKTTPFYGESGGQVGDRGFLRWEGGEFEVLDTRKPAEGLILHRGRVHAGALRVGARVNAVIDAARRRGCMAHHTATHLLNAALRALVNPNVRQAGSQVAPDRMRFDFNWFEAIPPETLDQIEAQVNRWIGEDRPVRTSSMPLSQVAGSDIIAIFDEKYGDEVRVIEVEGVSRELCGGTHCAHTSQIGMFRIASESSVASGIRRIEAVCGLAAYEWSCREHTLIRDLCRRFSAAEEELPARVDALSEQNRALSREMKRRETAAAAGRADEIAASVRDVEGIALINAFVGEAGPDAFKALLEAVRAKAPHAVIVLGATNEGKASFVAATPDALARRIPAGKLVGAIAKLAGGGGGGKPTLAQAGGKDGSKAESAIAATVDIVRTLIG